MPIKNILTSFAILVTAILVLNPKSSLAREVDIGEPLCSISPSLITLPVVDPPDKITVKANFPDNEKLKPFYFSTSLYGDKKKLGDLNEVGGGSFSIDITDDVKYPPLQTGLKTYYFYVGEDEDHDCRQTLTFNIRPPHLLPDPMQFGRQEGQDNDTMIPELIITNLLEFHYYHIRLDGSWDGDDLTQAQGDPDHIWQTISPTSIGEIKATYVCGSGEAHDQPQCDEELKRGTYIMKVYVCTKAVVGDLSNPEDHCGVDNPADHRDRYILQGELKFEGPEQFIPGQNPCQEDICDTALGNIPTNISGFAERVLAIAIGLGGGIALVFMVFGSIKILTSSGDPQKVAAGRDMIVAAIAGLLFLIFSVLILRFIGQTFNLPFS